MMTRRRRAVVTIMALATLGIVVVIVAALGGLATADSRQAKQVHLAVVARQALLAAQDWSVPNGPELTETWTPLAVTDLEVGGVQVELQVRKVGARFEAHVRLQRGRAEYGEQVSWSARRSLVGGPG